MEEMEMRIDSQKQTLGARDESIQRLLEMLQGQGQSQGHWGRGQRPGIITMAAQEAEAHLENMHVREVCFSSLGVNDYVAEPFIYSIKVILTVGLGNMSLYLHLSL